MVKLEEFFNFHSQEPINRLAYTKEDMDYKIKIIEKMKEIGMQVTVDEALNICGTIKIGNNPEKTLAIGSHTDSVGNGGQYDGPVGVITGLQVVDQLANTKQINGMVKVVIYACEESTRFGNACIGSKYLKGNITKQDFHTILDKSGVTLAQAIKEGKDYLKENVKQIQEVDKIFSGEQVDYSLESHIEQYQMLEERYQKSKKEPIGIITSVGSAVRVEYETIGQKAHTGSTPMKERKNAYDAVCYIGNKVRKLGKKYDKEGLGKASQIGGEVINDDGGYNQIKDRARARIDFRLSGENTPEKVLQDFEKIVKKAERKTKTKVIPTIKSKGTPTITSLELNQIIAKVCQQEGLEPIETISGPGQDTGYIPAKQKTMIFIRSTGGSHNEKEKAEKEAIVASTKVLKETVKELLKERFKDSYKCEVQGIKSLEQQPSQQKSYEKQETR